MTSGREPADEHGDVNPESNAENSLPKELLEAIPEDRREEFRRRLGGYFLEVRREERYTGPLLPAREAEAWEKLVPGSAKRSFDLYERQQIKRMEAHDRILTSVEERSRQDVEMKKNEHNDSVEVTKSVIKIGSEKTRRGQWIGFAGALLLFAGAIHLVNIGENSLAISVLIFEVVAFASVYVIENRKTRNERSSSGIPVNQVPQQGIYRGDDG